MSGQHSTSRQEKDNAALLVIVGGLPDGGEAILEVALGYVNPSRVGPEYCATSKNTA